ncbi:hypothetical protein [Maribacter hydrothermalis]|uniref:Uncharacterized protein n=1 Tax=Maribacter hydrothermalis TaxID=1836467 RepID=A0A1B7Z7Y7_9FLAO|nr:hypothetical protein [Maribacter hydrothermalis]APQ19176.1 hypothetical protein BTR34_18425 [Maribacter hydrothermalis]OBR38813.1 hypothetical protein A9200_03860 [Maribacter hydrothermalis]
MIPKTYPEFEKSLELSQVPEEWTDGLKAAWYDAKGDWESSHNIAQDMHNTLGSWLHAYLHRKEGDRFNAGYWYRLAKKEYPTITLDEELKSIVDYIIAK